MNHNPEEYTFPSHFPQVAQELCTRLLQQNPNDRLGAGTNADGNGYVALKVSIVSYFKQLLVIHLVFS